MPDARRPPRTARRSCARRSSRAGRPARRATGPAARRPRCGPGPRSRRRRRGHLDVAHRRPDRLALERGAARQDHSPVHRVLEDLVGSAVPEQPVRVAGVDRGHGLAPGDLRQEAEMGAPVVQAVRSTQRHTRRAENVVAAGSPNGQGPTSKSPSTPGLTAMGSTPGARVLAAGGRDVAGAAGDGAGRRDLLVPEERLAEVHLFGGDRIAGGLRGRRQLRLRRQREKESEEEGRAADLRSGELVHRISVLFGGDLDADSPERPRQLEEEERARGRTKGSFAAFLPAAMALTV